MQIYRSLDNLKIANSCVAIGIFDGVHRGHQEILRQAHAAAGSAALGASVALTFDPNPAVVLAPERAPFSIASLDQRLEWMDSLCGIDCAVVIPFDPEFASLTPGQFVDDVLAQKLGARQVFVGADFRYGRGRQGSVMDLEAAGATHDFEVTIVHPISEGGERVSSTRIRALVAAGDVQAANHLLGHSFALRGPVVRGKQLGRELGFPTANVAVADRQLLPEAGVYAGRAVVRGGGGIAEGRFRAAISVGTNPTTEGAGAPVRVEAFLLDGFEGDLYDRTLDIEFAARIRPQEKFASLDELVSQMGRDVAQIKLALDNLE